MPQRQPSPSRQDTRRLHSPALYLGSVTVSDRPSRPAALLSGTRIKALVFPALHWLIRHTPAWLGLLPARLATGLLRLSYRRRGYRLRGACDAVATLAHSRNLPVAAPRHIHRRFLANALGVIENYFILYRRGIQAVLPTIHMDSTDVETVRQLIRRHGGAVLAVPHNVGSAFSALYIGHAFDMLLVAKNPPTRSRTRIALDFYERMKVSVLMVRGGNPFELSRSMFNVLKAGKLVAATLDNIDKSDNRVTVEMFGEQIGLAGWAARIASRMQVPVIPAWFRSTGRELQVVVGEPVLGLDTRATVQHYARFFEQQILSDPASWAYLADKHWQSLLARAADRTPDGKPATHSAKKRP